MYTSADAPRLYAEKTKIADALVKDTIAKYHTREAVQTDAVKDIEGIMRDAVKLKFLDKPLTATADSRPAGLDVITPRTSARGLPSRTVSGRRVPRKGDGRIVARHGEELLAALDSLFDGQRPEDRADHQPADALGALGREVAAVRVGERLPPRVLALPERAHDASLHPS